MKTYIIETKPKRIIPSEKEIFHGSTYKTLNKAKSIALMYIENRNYEYYKIYEIDLEAHCCNMVYYKELMWVKN